MDMVIYKSFEISPKPRQLAESGEWSLNLNIFHHMKRESVETNFNAANTFKTREEAVAECLNFGKRVIDGKVPGCTVADL